VNSEHQSFDPSQVDVAITGLGLWLPGASTTQQLEVLLQAHTFPRQSEVEPPTGQSIEVRARRRASRLSRALADACAAAINQAGWDASQVATVFGSTLGEAHTMITLLGQMWRREEMSPMGFATSVHSAASGTVSISAGNRAFTTSLSADYDTASASLLEGWGVATALNLPTIVVCGDDHSPQDFVPETESFDLLAVALALSVEPTSSNKPVVGHISLPHGLDPSRPVLPPIASSAHIARNPQAGLLDLVAHLLAGRKGQVRLDRGLGNGCVVTIK
jgi:Beta-ketoacyl synthase, N-terminal domain